MTKEIRNFIKKGMNGSSEKQSKLFNQNFITKYLYKKAVIKGESSIY